ncbi:MAG: hypothetical protein O3B64_03885 [bacterium]|nr:hypothetical protein [bacterium]MDA1024726.1 hypothetical protein [bacterium]
MIDFRPLLNLNFWFDLKPSALTTTASTAFFVFFVGLVLTGLIIRILARKRKKADRYLGRIYLRSGAMVTIMGLLGLFWFFLADQQIYLFGAKFWLLIWVIVGVIWKISIYRYVKNVVPEKRKIEQSKADVNKYLPRKKR